MCVICVITSLSQMVITSMGLTYTPVPSDIQYVTDMAQSIVYEKQSPMAIKQLEELIPIRKSSALEMEQYYGQIMDKVMERNEQINENAP